MSLSVLHQQDFGVVPAPFISGKFLDGGGLLVIAHVNPSTGEVQAELRLGRAAEIDAAVRSAKTAQKQWMAMTPYARIACFKRLHALFGLHGEQLAFLAPVNPASQSGCR